MTGGLQDARNPALARRKCQRVLGLQKLRAKLRLQLIGQRSRKDFALQGRFARGLQPRVPITSDEHRIPLRPQRRYLDNLLYGTQSLLLDRIGPRLRRFFRLKHPLEQMTQEDFKVGPEFTSSLSTHLVEFARQVRDLDRFPAAITQRARLFFTPKREVFAVKASIFTALRNGHQACCSIFSSFLSLGAGRLSPAELLEAAEASPRSIRRPARRLALQVGGGQAKVTENSMKCTNRNVARSVDRDRGRTPVVVSYDSMRATLSHDYKTVRSESAQQFLAVQSTPKTRRSNGLPFSRSGDRDDLHPNDTLGARRDFDSAFTPFIEAKLDNLTCVVKGGLDGVAPGVRLGQRRHDHIVCGAVGFQFEQHDVPMQHILQLGTSGYESLSKDHDCLPRLRGRRADGFVSSRGFQKRSRDDLVAEN